MPALLVKLFASKWLRAALPYIALFLALMAAWWYVSGLEAKVREQQGAINVLTVKLDTEEQARRKDVAGLVALSSGLSKASLDTKSDRAIMEKTIDAANPTPVSPGLSALIAGLRQSDATAKPTAAAGANR